MSIDTHILLRTALSDEEVRAALLGDRELTKLGLTQSDEENVLSSEPVTLMVMPWEEDDRDLIEHGFKTASVTITVIPGRGSAGFEGTHRAIATVMRLIPGDVCLANQNSSGPDALRLGSVVYVNPDWFGPEHLIDFGYRPERVVVGISKEIVVSLA